MRRRPGVQTLAICGSATPSVSSETASTSRLDPLRVLLDEVGVRLRQRHGDPVGQLEPLLLAHRVQRVDQVVDAALELELVVERRVERDGDAVRPQRPPSPPCRRARRGPRRRRARGRRPGSRRPRAARTRPRPSAARTAPSSVPSFGPSSRQVRLHAAARSPRPGRTRPPSRAAPRRSRPRGPRRAARPRRRAAAAAGAA